MLFDFTDFRRLYKYELPYANAAKRNGQNCRQ